ncbi:hypothetical protein PICMEDRAFT_15571 [Pichia membranifaciens NRRL Y-2026]|uniref:Ubiquitin-conjugating enzyme E2 H n=1 Tax=Pichia membranifaciens NRRL Y-2026 TaxID=763406 RepID=A0A1E3NQ21_9ASCO|nr:hypothetical protein PICMEDRAFT_15571 [Pichia membranifaciens NRRL Y-2026]ODQ47643.1 hypothetical protein PICMEDRAFT_15571 [Pichia membranifaciens NRRL Y-2026]
MKLLMSSDFKASLIDDNLKELCVCLEGPRDTPYEGGLWKVHVELPEQYPYKSPSIGFETKIFHPNIDEQSGSVCLDVINQTWSPMFTITHIFETFIPQLLNYPNAADPLNGDASSLYLSNKALYEDKVRTYVRKYANRSDVLRQFNEEMGLEPDSDDEASGAVGAAHESVSGQAAGEADAVRAEPHGDKGGDGNDVDLDDDLDDDLSSVDMNDDDDLDMDL